MTARSVFTPQRLLAVLAAGLVAAAPTVGQPMPRVQRGASAQPRQMRAAPRGQTVGPRAVAGPQRGASVQGRRGPGALRGIGPRQRSLNQGNTIIVDRGGSLLNRGAPMAVRTGRMGGNDAAFPVFSPAQLSGGAGGRVRLADRHSGRFLDDDDDDFRFAVHLGGGNVWIGDDPVYAPHGYWNKRRGYRRYWYPQAAYFPGVTYVNAAPYWYDDYRDTYPVFTTDQGYIDPFVNPTGPQYVPTTPPPPPRELTPVERAQQALLSNEPDLAVTILREHARTNPEDADAVRRLAVALLETGEPAQAVAVMVMAYDKDPTLASRPIPAPMVYRDPDDLRHAVGRAVTYANRVNTSSSWLLVAALMQAEGRDAVARRMVERARGLGLAERIADPMRAALTG